VQQPWPPVLQSIREKVSALFWTCRPTTSPTPWSTSIAMAATASASAVGMDHNAPIVSVSLGVPRLFVIRWASHLPQWLAGKQEWSLGEGHLLAMWAADKQELHTRGAKAAHSSGSPREHHLPPYRACRHHPGAVRVLCGTGQSRVLGGSANVARAYRLHSDRLHHKCRKRFHGIPDWEWERGSRPLVQLHRHRQGQLRLDEQRGLVLVVVVVVNNSSIDNDPAALGRQGCKHGSALQHGSEAVEQQQQQQQQAAAAAAVERQK